MRLAAVALVLATALSAQRGGGGFGGFRGGGGGFRPGMPGSPVHRPPAVPGHGSWGGGYRPGPGFRVPPTYGRVGYPAYGYGSVWGLGGAYSYPFGWYGLPWWGTTSAVYNPADYYPYSASPSVTIVVVPASNQPSYAAAYDADPVTPTPRVQVQAAPEKPRPLVTESWAYLIAAKDGTIWLARDYSVRDGFLTFSVGDAPKRLRLEDVDRVLTEELNREQGVAVRLP